MTVSNRRRVPQKAYPLLAAKRPLPDSPLLGSLMQEADFRVTFRVSDAARRRKVDGARTRGPHAVRYGDFDFALIPTAADGADKRKGPIAAGPILR